MKVKNKGRQSLLEKFPNEQDFQQQQPSLPVTLDNLSQKKKPCYTATTTASPTQRLQMPHVHHYRHQNLQ